jgi:hypothetical protein
MHLSEFNFLNRVHILNRYILEIYDYANNQGSITRLKMYHMTAILNLLSELPPPTHIL